MVSPAQRALAVILVAILLGNPVTAYERISASGHVYEMSCNSSGYVLTSKYPVARWFGQGADTRTETRIEKLFLGKSCDAFHPQLGGGRWCWANGGFKVDFADLTVGFPRQELFCSADDNLGLGCQC